ncbi:hypothetical protein [Streptantibioticus silvisoli]|uniref:ANTAR domain-containing protein n=1 Tax=Streptantibioticus silvisoli TaxID=2705255 RepID=A0ABT6W1B4_9ACTN|nr:hypothetical protein [Streptantibioticus silvisoli]MDI5964545.1 hypothetical protein [Streptantibioticus silvisoli]
MTTLRRHQLHCHTLRATRAPEEERTAAARVALEARTDVTEALVALQLCTGDQNVLDHASRAADVTVALHQAADQEDMDRRARAARTAHDAFVVAARSLTLA